MTAWKKISGAGKGHSINAERETAFHDLPPCPQSAALFISHVQKNEFRRDYHLFNTHLLSASYMPVTIPGVRDTAGNETDRSHCPRGAHILVEGNRQLINKQNRYV